jgi:uncharacterized flavoprotein (TIGR03862 family)
MLYRSHPPPPTLTLLSPRTGEGQTTKLMSMPNNRPTPLRLAIVGGGPAGLMAAEVARAAGVAVDLYEAKGSVGRKFLLAGKGGLNLTHAEPFDRFVTRYGARQQQVQAWLSAFNADDVRGWAKGLGFDTFVGTSDRVFPADMKAAPLLRAWVRRLREQGVQFHVQHRCAGINPDRTLRFDTPQGERSIQSDAVVLALGGGSWPELGSDGLWVEWLSTLGVDIAPLQSANCGFDVGWSKIFAERYAGQPVKTVTLTSGMDTLQGEFLITAGGVEGGAIYALAATLRDTIARQGSAVLQIDMLPNASVAELQRKLSAARGGRSLTEHLRRTIGLQGVKLGLVYECLTKQQQADMALLARGIKNVPIVLRSPRPLAEAISTAGGISFAALNSQLMVESLPGIFCAGEMLDWEAPTGGYLLTACLASGRVAGYGASAWLQSKSGDD